MEPSECKVSSIVNNPSVSTKFKKLPTRQCRCLKTSNIEPMLNHLTKSIEEKDNARNENKVITNDLSGPIGHFDKPMSDIKPLNINSLQKLLNQKTPTPNKEWISQLSYLNMLIKPPRSKKRVLIFCSIVVIIFAVASSLPFLVDSLRSSPGPITSVSFIPIHNVVQIFRPRESSYSRRVEEETASMMSQVFISIKTTSKYHYPRLVILLETWVSLVTGSTWVFTDKVEGDTELRGRLGDHLVETNCSSSHHRLSLCCKMEKEFEYFLRSGRRWWCHFDDDNFVNVDSLSRLLSRHDPALPWYLGKTSTASPLRIMTSSGNSSFWFATGGAGFCVSRTLALKMAPHVV